MSRTGGAITSRSRLLGWLGAALILGAAATPVRAQGQGTSLRAEITQLLSTARAEGSGAPQAPEPPRLTTDEAGYVLYIGAPPSQAFTAPPGAPSDPTQRARAFLLQNARLFGMTPGATDVRLVRTREKQGRTYVRFQQTHRGLPVFAAEIVVQIGSGAGI